MCAIRIYAPSSKNRRASQFDIAEGINRFTVGLAKKAIIANTCAALADTLLVPDGGDFSLVGVKKCAFALGGRACLYFTDLY